MASSHVTLDLPPLPLGTAVPVTSDIEVREEATGYGDVGGAYRGSGGGKLRPLRRTSGKKTPYDRPASGRHATPGGLSLPAATSSSISSSIPSRIVGSASRLISSSASYLFSSFFSARKTPAITNGHAQPATDLGSPTQELQRKRRADDIVKQEENEALVPDDALALVVDSNGLERTEIGVSKVEEIIKQQSWSREQVDRLTQILQARVTETTSVTAATTTVTCVHEDNDAMPVSEAQRWREELRKARSDLTPIEVARAYMGERTSLPSIFASPFQGTAHQHDRVTDLQPPPRSGLYEERFRTTPVRTWVRSPASVRGPPRNVMLDEEWMSVGPIRRARQKPIAWGNSSPSPYARGSIGEALPSQTFSSPPVQASQTARKILDTLEKLTPSPKEKSSEDELKLNTGKQSPQRTPDISSTWARKSAPVAELSRFSKYSEPGFFNGVLSPKVSKDGKSKGHVTTLIAGLSSEKERMMEGQLNARTEAGLHPRMGEVSSSAIKPPPLSSLSGSFGSSSLSSGMLSTASILDEQPSFSQFPASKFLFSATSTSLMDTPLPLAAAGSLDASSVVIEQVSSPAGISLQAPETHAERKLAARTSRNNENGALKGLGMEKKPDHDVDVMVNRPEHGLKTSLSFSFSPGLSTASSMLNFTPAVNSVPGCAGSKLFASSDMQALKETASPFSFARSPNPAPSVSTSSAFPSFSVIPPAGSSISNPAFSLGFAQSRPSMPSQVFGLGGEVVASQVSSASGLSLATPKSTASVPVFGVGSVDVAGSSGSPQGSLFSPPITEKNALSASAAPLFSFTSPSVEPKLPAITFKPDTSLPPPPIFSFGSNATSSSSPPTFSFGPNATSMPPPVLFSEANTLSPLLPALPSAGSSPPTLFSGSSGAVSPWAAFSFGSSSTTVSCTTFSLVSTPAASAATLTSVFSSPSSIPSFSSPTAATFSDGQPGLVSSPFPSFGASNSSSSQSGLERAAGVAEKAGRKYIKAKRRK